jgi:hypothetical protein
MKKQPKHLKPWPTEKEFEQDWIDSPATGQHRIVKVNDTPGLMPSTEPSVVRELVMPL